MKEQHSGYCSDGPAEGVTIAFKKSPPEIITLPGDSLDYLGYTGPDLEYKIDRLDPTSGLFRYQFVGPVQ